MFDIKKYISGIFVGSMLITSANAQEFNFDYSEDIYLKFYTGFHDYQDVGWSSGASVDGFSWNVDAEYGFEPGWTVGTIVGYPLFDPSMPFLGNIRGELDASYDKAYTDDLEIDASANFTLPGGSLIAYGAGTIPMNGKVEILNFYNNFIYHSRQFSAINPYFGLGIGYSYAELNIEDLGGEVIGAQHRFSNVGAQFILGADLFTSNNFSGGARVVGRAVNYSEEAIGTSRAISGQFDIRYNF